MSSSPAGTNWIFLISGYGGATVTLLFLVNSELRLVSNVSVLFLLGMRNITLAGMFVTYMANIRSPTMLFLMKLLLVSLECLVPCPPLPLSSHLLLILLATDPIFVLLWVQLMMKFSVLRTSTGLSAFINIPCLLQMTLGAAELAVHDEALLDGGASLSALATITLDDSTFSLDVIDSFFSLIDSSSFPPLVDTFSFPSMEPDIIWDHLLFPSSFPPSLITDTTAFHAVGLSVPHILCSFDLTKAPSSYSEAIACPDAPAWHAAMDHECQSLSDMGAFKETDLPSGEKAIGLKWVYDYKTVKCLHWSSLKKRYIL